jgi:signal peptidase I
MSSQAEITRPAALPSRSLALLTAFATLWCSAGLGAAVAGRWRRAALWVAIDFLWAAVLVAGALTVHPRVMWACFPGLACTRVVAAVDAYRLARTAGHAGRWASLVVGWIVLMLFSFGLARGVIRPFLVESFKIPSGAMSPTLVKGDDIFVDKRRREPTRGDVIVFKYPLDPSTNYIKRVIALGGDVVEISRGAVAVNGKPVPREIVQSGCPAGSDGNDVPCFLWNETLDGRSHQIGTDTSLGERDFDRKVVPPGSLFVLGDNRDNSSDSRVWGFVPLDDVLGTVTFVWWSADANGLRRDRMNVLVR